MKPLPKASAGDLLDSLWQTWLDLLTLETSTIIKEKGMSAEKMGPLPHALIDIARDYAAFIQAKAGYDLGAWWDGAGRDQRRESEPPARGAPHPIALTTGPDTFDRLEWAARHALAEHLAGGGDAAERARNAMVLERIVRGSAEVARIVRGFEEDEAWRPFRDMSEVAVERARDLQEAPPLSPKDATRLRKIWDVGTEFVVLQTLIQIDGDVVTRLEPGLLEEKNCALILQVHGDSVAHSVRYWQFLVLTLQQFFRSLGRDAPRPH